ncbi:MAG TPA: hypothetical protein VFS67_08300 [Polyangiaceae bacterium]|nr:hypothetical protein [Polyangiaceae bacterium]
MAEPLDGGLRAALRRRAESWKLRLTVIVDRSLGAELHPFIPEVCLFARSQHPVAIVRRESDAHPLPIESGYRGVQRDGVSVKNARHRRICHHAIMADFKCDGEAPLDERRRWKHSGTQSAP